MSLLSVSKNSSGRLVFNFFLVHVFYPYVTTEFKFYHTILEELINIPLSTSQKWTSFLSHAPCLCRASPTNSPLLSCCCCCCVNVPRRLHTLTCKKYYGNEKIGCQGCDNTYSFIKAWVTQQYWQTMTITLEP